MIRNDMTDYSAVVIVDDTSSFIAVKLVQAGYAHAHVQRRGGGQTLYVELKPFLLECHFMTQTVLVGATHQERFWFL